MDVYDRREGEAEEREAMKRRLCDAISRKIDESVRKSRILAEVDKILADNDADKRNQQEIREMINKRDIKWYPRLWQQGYFCYKLKYLKGDEKRREALKERMNRLKRIRPAAERYKPVGCAFLPATKRLIIDISQLENKKRGFVAMVQMVNYYCDNYGVYQYSPLPGTGYKYYSGEKIIIYMITPEMNKNQVNETVKRIKRDEIEGFSLKQTYKVIINANEWRGCEDWRREMILDYNMAGKQLDIREQMVLAWKNCRDMEELNTKCHFLAHCQRKQLEPWPFTWHQFSGMELVDESRENLEQRQEAFRAVEGNSCLPVPREAN